MKMSLKIKEPKRIAYNLLYEELSNVGGTLWFINMFFEYIFNFGGA